MILLQNPRLKNRENLWETLSGAVGAGNNLKIYLKPGNTPLQSFSSRLKLISPAL